MKTKNIFMVLLILGFVLALSIIGSASEYRSHKIGRLWDVFFDSSTRDWSKVMRTPYHLLWPANRNVGIGWPAQAWKRNTWRGPLAGGGAGYWIGAKNWKNEEGTVLPIHVAELGFWYFDEGSVGMPMYIKKMTRRQPPKVYVDGQLISTPFPESDGDGLDPDIPSDEMIENVTRTNIGVDLFRRTYAYTNHHFQDLIMIETIFTNTGNIDQDDEIEIPGQVLSDVYINNTLRAVITREGAAACGYPHWWGSEWHEYYGENYADYLAGDMTADSLKVFYSWDGDETERTPDYEDEGNPHKLTGMWLSPQYIGYTPIYSDKSPQEKVDDPAQPLTTRWEGFALLPSTSKPDLPMSKMYEFMTLGHRPSPLEEGFTNTGFDGARQALLNTAYGPYQMQPGDTWRMVHAEVANGLSTEKCIEYGAAYKEALDSGNPDSFTWTDTKSGITYKGLDAKNALLATGKDSLFKTVSRAQWLFENDFNCPDPPMSPSLYVKSSGGKVIVEWGNEPENEPDPDTGVMDFEGYRLYRAIGRYDSTNWELVYDGQGHNFEDTDLARGVAVYYCVTAYDDGTQNTWGIIPGEKLESSKFWSMTTVPAYRLKEAENKLEMVDVVPNPYNIHSAPFQYPSEPNKIMFMNLTPYCTINIYTMTGDKVTSIEHTSGSGEEPWFQVTDSNQFITSGVYIYYIVAKDESGNETGDTITGKFVVVR